MWGRNETTDTHPDVTEPHAAEAGGGEPSTALNAWRSVPQPASKDPALILERIPCIEQHHLIPGDGGEVSEATLAGKDHFACFDEVSLSVPELRWRW